MTAQEVWVLVEHRQQRVADITFELLGLGREVAQALQAPLKAVLLGHQARDLASALGAADAVLYMDHPALTEVTPEAYARALKPLLQERRPRLMVIGLTNFTLGLGPYLACELQWPFVNFCKGMHVEDGSVVITCLLYGGKMEAEVELPAEPGLIGVMPGASPADKGRDERFPLVEEVLSPPGLEQQAVQFLRYIQPEAADVDITTQEVLVSVGRGIQNQENIALAEELAQALGGAVCASRPVIDQGWLPLSRQVGKSGMTVKPKLYLALGISGAPEHVEGMKNAGLIIAINTDLRAPIFNVAHYGIVADVLEVLPALIEAIRGKKGG
ncbi:MAG: electron transfer flavoprotein subunit alpha/FixB family protein [Anaerolineae bacterium]|nr:electron transfer flavoprotein subunit alpha/FixB family protein [Anaerolineae bacterium]MDW8097971.1 electron transfer flavoprotein subunit alpha/FixB family protein [Anaerolineae bacterium]